MEQVGPIFAGRLVAGCGVDAMRSVEADRSNHGLTALGGLPVYLDLIEKTLSFGATLIGASKQDAAKVDAGDRLIT